MSSSTFISAILIVSCFITMFCCVHPAAALSTTALRMAVWSDSKAVKEYQDFLASGAQTITLTEDCPSVILVSPNEMNLDIHELNPMAQALLKLGRGDDVILSPYQPLPALGENEYPIYITLPPHEILPFIENLDDAYKLRNSDFCFFSGGQYGNIEEILQQKGLCRDTMTQILIAGLDIAGNRIGDVSVNLGPDSYGEDKIAGECASCGKWKGSIAQRLESRQIRCSTDFYRDWRRKQWERNCLDAIFNLVGAVRSEPTTLADVANFYEEEVSDILWEITGSLRGWKAVTLLFGFEERLFGFAEKVATEQQCTINDEMYPYILGNTVFTQSPKCLEYLHYAKNEMGLLQTVDLPPMTEESEPDLNLPNPSRMRQGNLRADGLV